MAAMRGPRLQVGSAAWIAEERSSARRIAQSEVEEFSYSARNELDWLNEHMASIFDQKESNIAEIFKTPGKLRGKTPRTARKANPREARVPLSDVFAATPNGSASRVEKHSKRIQSPRIHASAAKASPRIVKASASQLQIFSPKPHAKGPATQDSGYYGSQNINPPNNYVGLEDIVIATDSIEHPPRHERTKIPLKHSPRRGVGVTDSPEKTFQTAKEEQTTRLASDDTMRLSKKLGATPQAPTSWPQNEPLADEASGDDVPQQVMDATETQLNEARSPSEGSSPIRPVVRKSSLNFASLPAREPLTAGKSIGARVSRTSHLDHNRTSYYNRPTGGKSLGNHAWHDDDEDEEPNATIAADENAAHTAVQAEALTLNHTRTYTQRLQDQISMLGKSHSKAGRQSKSNPNVLVPQQSAAIAQPAVPSPSSPLPSRMEAVTTTPGAFPEDDDDDDDWIQPPAATDEERKPEPIRPMLPKSHTADVMEGVHDMDTVGQVDFAVHQETSTAATQRPDSVPHTISHGKSASVSAGPSRPLTLSGEDMPSLTKAATVPNPTSNAVAGIDYPETPSKMSSRNFRDSPLRQVKNKLSSILKSSRGLLASSAAISAEGKSSILSPSASRLAYHPTPSSDSLRAKAGFNGQGPRVEVQDGEQESSHGRPVARRTRASSEREKEEKRAEKEEMRAAEQMGKLDKAREKEREKARAFSKEQEKVATMEKEVEAKENERATLRQSPKATRSSPRKPKMPEESVANPTEQDTEMPDAPLIMPPPSLAQSDGTAQSVRVKRPIKPSKDIQVKAKQAPTVIKVNTGSQHSQYHTANVPSTKSSDTTGPSNAQTQHQLSNKASKASLHTKTSTQSLKSSASSTGRPKALDLAAKKKEQDEREVQRRRDAKAEMERKRAAAQEEQRKQDQQRRQEAERQKQQKDREQAAQTEAKKSVQRQAAIEKAKQTRAPPPAVRSHPHGPPDFSLSQESAVQRMEAPPTRPPSRMNSGMHRSQDEASRPVTALLSNAAKPGTKRVLAADNIDDGKAKRLPSRGGPSYQAKEAKRRRTSDNSHDELNAGPVSSLKGPPVRPSAGIKKDLPKQSVFQNGYSNVPPSATRDLFKATVAAQHAGQAKTAHPLDMAQISKGAIPFAPNPNQAGASHKTPARPPTFNAGKSVVKTAQKSSPRFQNGELIELPEIQTDDEDDEDDGEAYKLSVAAWADSPDLRRALMRQETMDPSQIFGPPATLNMEEVFSKNKDRWHKFRARGSSANWSGMDRLTDEDIRKDMVARDKMRREGGWSYDMGKDMI